MMSLIMSIMILASKSVIIAEARPEAVIKIMKINKMVASRRLRWPELVACTLAV